MLRRISLTLCLLTLCSGCNMFPRWMHPGNLWKLNGQAPPSNDAMYFSVPDPDTSDPFLSGDAGDEQSDNVIPFRRPDAVDR
ncbi:MAG: hypothetical protein ACK5Q5_07080 [Planctomycetaceae bacterium]